MKLIRLTPEYEFNDFDCGDDDLSHATNVFRHDGNWIIWNYNIFLSSPLPRPRIVGMIVFSLLYSFIHPTIMNHYTINYKQNINLKIRERFANPNIFIIFVVKYDESDFFP